MPRKILDHILRFIEEARPYTPNTWRTPLVFGLLFGVLGCLSLSPIYLVIGVILLSLSALAWRFGWEF